MKTQSVGRSVVSRTVCVSVASSTFHSCVCTGVGVRRSRPKEEVTVRAAGNPVRNEQAKVTVSCV